MYSLLFHQLYITKILFHYLIEEIINLSPHGFYISKYNPLINQETYSIIESRNHSYTSQEVLNIIVTDENFGKFSYFSASQLKGNIAKVNIADLSKLLEHRFKWSCIHILFHKSLSNKIKEFAIDLEFACAQAVAPSQYMYAFISSLKSDI